jgi:glucosamine--fructose-6-phosphate aminotransferase (isomerizing)
MAQCVVLGRGFHYATACEWALKLEELTYMVAEPYSTADFRHGRRRWRPRLPGARRRPAAPSTATTWRCSPRLVEERGVDLVALSDRTRRSALARTPIRLPRRLPEWLSPIAAVLAAQLFAITSPKRWAATPSRRAGCPRSPRPGRRFAAARVGSKPRRWP